MHLHRKRDVAMNAQAPTIRAPSTQHRSPLVEDERYNEKRYRDETENAQSPVAAEIGEG